MKHQAFRPAALMLSFLLAAAVPARAGTVHYADAVHVFTHGRGPASDVRLRVAPQSGTAASAAQQQTGQRNGGPASSTQQTGQDGPGSIPAGPGSATTAPADATLSQTGGQVETVDLGDVTGTVCDCGEIPVTPIPGGGFPLWPLLGAIPLVCVTGICTPDDEERTPGCVINCGPDTPIPEPASLLLFGTSLLALGAGARRRLSRRREGEGEVIAAEEVI